MNDYVLKVQWHLGSSNSVHTQILRSCKKIMTVNTFIYIDSLVYLDEFDPVCVEHPGDPDDGAM